jgi:acyl-[acyl-carrier-protein]-phospholipid O-acyltransferase / long-chain-fatty-acid--[acyl-carrier-protein] ligase
MVGLLLPASAAGALVNTALLFAGRVPVNLNFTAGGAAMESAIARCGIRTIVTARAFLAKARLPEREGMVFVEDLRNAAPPLRRLVIAAAAWLLPSALLASMFASRPRDAHAPAVVLFSSGSTGEPKGVVLSHHNILSNVEATAQVLDLRRGDSVLGILPFFHAFGVTGTLWTPLICGIGSVFHPSPTDAKGIGQLARKHGPTVLVATPTFCNTYARVCEKEDFASVRLALVGAERLSEPVAVAFREKFGVALFEGYGATEMGPVVAANLPDVAHWAVKQTGTKAGTVGHPLPGVAARVVDLTTGETLPEDREGMLLLKSPARMIGYLADPERTAAVLRDGWYVTGDVVVIDADGFIRITDRLSRFSKIAGEMIPHGTIEAALAEVAGVTGCCVTAAPDPQRGERLVAFYTGEDAVTPSTILDALGRCGLPRLWLPKLENIRRLAELPLLAATGKLDLRRLREMAVEAAA